MMDRNSASATPDRLRANSVGYSARQTASFAAQAGQHFQAVHIRQVEIQQNTIRPPAFRQLDSPSGPTGLGKIEFRGVRVFEAVLIDFPVDAIIFDYQYFPHAVS